MKEEAMTACVYIHVVGPKSGAADRADTVISRDSSQKVCVSAFSLAVMIREEGFNKRQAPCDSLRLD